MKQQGHLTNNALNILKEAKRLGLVKKRSQTKRKRAASEEVDGSGGDVNDDREDEDEDEDKDETASASTECHVSANSTKRAQRERNVLTKEKEKRDAEDFVFRGLKKKIPWHQNDTSGKINHSTSGVTMISNWP